MTKIPVSVVLGLLASPVFAIDDPHSYADTKQFAVRHVSLDLAADFAAHRLEGSATLTVERVSAEARQLYLDTRDLEIRSVQRVDADGPGTQPLDFSSMIPTRFSGAG